MLALTFISVAAWGGVFVLLAGSVVRVLRGRSCANDDFLAVLSLLAALLTGFFLRRLIDHNDDLSFVALTMLGLILALWVYRLGWGRGRGRCN